MTKYELMNECAQKAFETNGKVTFVFVTGKEKTVATLEEVKNVIYLAQLGSTEDIVGMY